MIALPFSRSRWCEKAIANVAGMGGFSPLIEPSANTRGKIWHTSEPDLSSDALDRI
jgi:hypothetical protein